MADYFTLLRDRVTLKYRSIDRIFLQAYVPKLQTVGQVCTFLRWQRRFPIPSSAAFGKIGDAYVEAIYCYAKAHNIPVVRFEKGENKEKTARPFLEVAAREGKDRVVLIGIAQEKASAWRSWKSKGQEKAAHPHMEWGRQMTYINHFYFYLWDSDWGAAFWKTNAYAPYPIWLWLNGHEWAKRQLEKARVGYEALDNGFRSCEDPAALQKVCERLGPGAVKSPPRLDKRTGRPVISTSWPSVSLRSRRPMCLTDRKLAGCGLKASFAITSTSVGPIKSC